MSLIEIKPIKEREVLKEKWRQIILEKINDSFDSILRNSNELSNMIYSNKSGLTASEIVESMGTDASKILQIIWLTNDFINAIKPGAISDAPFNFLHDGEGNVRLEEIK